MTSNPNSKKGITADDWERERLWYVRTPGSTLAQVADRLGVSRRIVESKASPSSGQWRRSKEDYLKQAAVESEAHLADVIARDKADDLHVMKEIEFRVQRMAISALEMLFPPAGAPVEVLEAAEIRRGELSPKDLAKIALESARTLTETGRHVRLLEGHATAIFARAGDMGSDVMIPASVDEIRRREALARSAQEALQAASAGVIDIEGAPVSLALEVPPRRSPDRVAVGGGSPPPTSHNARNPGGAARYVTSKSEAAADVGL